MAVTAQTILPLALRETRFALKRLTSAAEIRAYFLQTAEPKLNLGCGWNIIDGWLNADMRAVPRAIFVDGAAAWPFPDDSFDAILCEHVVEHMPKEAGFRLLSECHRTLRKGGLLRIVTPDMAFLAKLALDQIADEQTYCHTIKKWAGRDEMSACDAVNECFYNWGHRYIYTRNELAAALAKAGYVDLVETRAGQPQARIFAGAEGHGKVIGEEINALEAMAFEARRA